MNIKLGTFLKILVLNLCAYLALNLSIATFFYANPVFDSENISVDHNEIDALIFHL